MIYFRRFKFFINSTSRLSQNDVNFINIEPGFYEDGNFGVRIETTLTVVNATTPVSYFHLFIEAIPKHKATDGNIFIKT